MKLRASRRTVRPMAALSLAAAVCAGLFLLPSAQGNAAPRQVLKGHIPAVVAGLQPIGHLPALDPLDVAIGLPLRDQTTLTERLRQIYDPASTMYHQYLTPAEFTEMFGPTKEDYESLLRFATSNNLEIVITHPNRTLVHARGSVADIERAFGVRMLLYQHPTEKRAFYAPDVEPSLELEVPVLHITGLDNLVVPNSTLRTVPVPKESQPGRTWGSGPGGLYSGNDFRAAYAPGVALTGSGQVVGILTFDGYYVSDIRTYEDNAGFPHVPLQNVFLGGFTGNPPGVWNIEISLDIEMVIAMAPGLSRIVVYGAPGHGYAVDLLNEMANPSHGEPLPRQLSTSFALHYEANVYQAFQQMASQGQSFFAYSGDNGAYTAYTGGPNDTLPFPPGDCIYVTCVGGTVLNTSGPGGYWISETTWPGSGGGPSPWGPADPNFVIPYWQLGLDMSVNHGSTTVRNCPDVAMVATDVMVICGNGATNGVSGTSISTPLWAGLTALVNQQAAANGRPPVGFINPAIYALGTSGSYASFFHDITTGNNTHGTVTNYFAVPGYDLCTGWGTPNGANLINALAGVWVDFNNPLSGVGSYENPYRTLAQGVSAVQSGGTILIKRAGSSTETPTINKALTIRAVGGQATIGAQ